MGAKASDGAVNSELSRNTALGAAQALIGNLLVGDVVPGAALEGAVLGEANNAVLGMEFGVHSLDYITYQRGLVVQLTKCPQYTVAIAVAGLGEALTAPDTRWEGGAVNLILDGAMPREVIACGRLLICDFHRDL